MGRQPSHPPAGRPGHPEPDDPPADRRAPDRRVNTRPCLLHVRTANAARQLTPRTPADSVRTRGLTCSSFHTHGSAGQRQATDDSPNDRPAKAQIRPPARHRRVDLPDGHLTRRPCPPGQPGTGAAAQHPPGSPQVAADYARSPHSGTTGSSVTTSGWPPTWPPPMRWPRQRPGLVALAHRSAAAQPAARAMLRHRLRPRAGETRSLRRRPTVGNPVSGATCAC